MIILIFENLPFSSCSLQSLSGLKTTSSDTWRTGRSVSKHERGLPRQLQKKCFLVQKLVLVYSWQASSTTSLPLPWSTLLLIVHFPPIVKSFVELVRFIFTIPGVEVFLSERISQDPLEKFFGCQRQRGCVNENPTVTEFCKNTQKLRVINSVCLDSVKGNCWGKKGTEPIDMEKENRPLPRRKYTKSNKSN